MGHPIEGLMEAAMGKIKGMVDVDTVIGEPVTAPNGTVIIPVSSVAFGFGAGGSDFGAKPGTQVQEKMFGGGCGGGASVKPMGFLVVANSSVRFIPMGGSNTAVDKIIDMVPGILDKLNNAIKSKSKKASENEYEENKNE